MTSGAKSVVRVQRRLAAILAADVVGYSRLMAADEAGTLAALRALRQGLIEPEIAAHGGRIVKLMGDGALVEFPSVVDAVECAVAMQQAMAAANAQKPEGRRIVLRIGINVGDIIIEDDDIYGDGVNVAARLEALAQPGGICISSAVREQVQNKVPISFADLGERAVKNIERPIHVFYVVMNGTEAVPAPATGSAPAAAATPARAGPAAAPAQKASIAVLPFVNMSGDVEQEYFADGISEDIITALSKISQLFVIARNSSFTFKGKAVDVAEVSKKLGVRFILEGSVRKAGNRVRITAQLIDGQSSGHLWADRFDRELTDIFAVQDEVTQEIVSALALNLTERERAQMPGEQSYDPQAYEYFLRGRACWWRGSKEASLEGKAMLQQAIERDPKMVPAYAFLAAMHTREYVNDWTTSPQGSLDSALKLARQAVALDANHAHAHWALGGYYLWTRQHDEAVREFERAIALDPNFALTHVLLAMALHYTGRSAEAVGIFDRIFALDPYHPDVYLHFQAQTYFQLGWYERAAEILKQRLAGNPNSDISHALLAACYGHLDRADEARTEWRELLRLNPGYSIEQRRKVLPYRNPADFEPFVDGLRKAGLVD
jgi:TolB-like protein/class 3 adenylate cyclase/Tfp pilus assembly protein PilF